MHCIHEFESFITVSHLTEREKKNARSIPMITAVAVKENQTVQVVETLKSLHNEKPVFLWTTGVLSGRYGGDVHRCIRDIMTILQQPGSSISVFAYCHVWLTHNELRQERNNLNASDNSDEDSDADYEARQSSTGRFNSDAVGLLYALCHWYTSMGISDNRLYIVFESGVPKRLKNLPGLIMDDKFLVSQHSPETTEAFSNLPSPLPDKLLVVGVIGSRGKTTTLRSFANPKSVWMYCHEIVNCELGESPRIVRSLFETASSRQSPSIVIMDDADLILSTPGRIMREIVDEICACVSNDFIRGYFLYSARARESVPEVLLANTNQFIDLD
jgi:hypothetical protein